ncbi:MAG TPA: tripartite tricarboxylate transporter substrate binding protein [Pseudolabrys sp.]|nr:tripartite tricarboxylate transporter substrate binding protein [Pseudolabrys sp.]
MRRFVTAGFIATAAMLSAVPVFAQNYPDRPVRVIVPTPPGGPVDVMARLLCNGLPTQLGQNFYIENKPGAGNIIGSKLAAEAAPDGYTLHITAASGLIMSPMIYRNAGYDASNFQPIALIAEAPQVLVVDPKLPIKSVADLVAYAKAHPGKLNYSTGGIGTLPHLTAELFKQLSGTDIVHVPYKGGGLALQAVFAGETQLTFDTVGTSLALIRDGKLRALAVGVKTRSAELPDVPTMVEAGFPQLTTGAWTAILAPRGTPEAIIAKVNAAANKAITSEPMKGTLAKLGAQPRGGTPKELADYIASETAKWKPIVQKLGLYQAK